MNEDLKLGRFRRAVNWLLGLVGLQLFTKAEVDGVSTALQRSLDTVKLLALDVNDLNDEAAAVANAIAGSGSDPGDPELDLADRVSIAISDANLRAQTAEDSRNRTNGVEEANKRVAGMVSLVQRMVKLLDFGPDERPTEVQVVDRIQAMKKDIAWKGLMIRAMGRPELLHDPEFTTIRGAVSGFMFHWLKGALDGEMGPELTEDDTKREPAPNFLSFVLSGNGESVEVVIQRPTGKTPAALYHKTKARLDALLGDLEKALEARDEYRQSSNWINDRTIERFIEALERDSERANG